MIYIGVRLCVEPLSKWCDKPLESKYFVRQCVKAGGRECDKPLEFDRKGNFNSRLMPPTLFVGTHPATEIDYGAGGDMRVEGKEWKNVHRT